jgi:transcriptional accessory protein Tex/SPT6
LSDPLAELVKIDPKAIGVPINDGSNEAKRKLDKTVIVVNSVGININTASKHLLSYVSGIGEKLAVLFYTDLKMVLLKIEAAEKSTAFGRKKRIRESLSFAFRMLKPIR